MTTEKPALQTFEVEVTQIVRVTLDPSQFTPEFMSEFRESFFPFDTIEEHAEHIAQLAAREVYSLNPYLPDEFVEGYGPIGKMGISATVDDCETEILSGSA